MGGLMDGWILARYIVIMGDVILPSMERDEVQSVFFFIRDLELEWRKERISSFLLANK